MKTKHKFIILPIIAFALTSCQIPDFPFLPQRSETDLPPQETNTMTQETNPYETETSNSTSTSEILNDIYLGTIDDPISPDELKNSFDQAKNGQKINFYVEGVISSNMANVLDPYYAMNISNNKGDIYNFLSFRYCDVSMLSQENLAFIQVRNQAVGYLIEAKGTIVANGIASLRIDVRNPTLLVIKPNTEVRVPTEIFLEPKFEIYDDNIDCRTLNFYCSPSGVRKESLKFEFKGHDGLYIKDYDVLYCDGTKDTSDSATLSISYEDVKVTCEIKIRHASSDVIVRYLDVHPFAVGKRGEAVNIQTDYVNILDASKPYQVGETNYFRPAKFNFFEFNIYQHSCIKIKIDGKYALQKLEIEKGKFVSTDINLINLREGEELVNFYEFVPTGGGDEFFIKNNQHNYISVRKMRFELKAVN